LDESSRVDDEEACDFISIRPESKKRLSKCGDVPRHLGEVGGVSYECVFRGLDGIDDDGVVGVDELDDNSDLVEHCLLDEQIRKKFSKLPSNFFKYWI
jgi:hypothetical protein